MVSYKIETLDPNQYTLRITLRFEAKTSDTYLQMPYWRPGRYEAGNFSKNCIGLSAKAGGAKIQTRKLTAHKWHLSTHSGGEVVVTYRCYAADLTAGNTYLDSELLLINPVNCLVYVLGMEEVTMNLALDIPTEWKIATSMPSIGKRPGSFQCADLQELLDTPILATAEMDTLNYSMAGVDFYIHVCGSDHVDKEKIKKDFGDFTRAQIAAFDDFPVTTYHFLILLLPHKAYHGVEHESSTVIIMGPSAELQKWTSYKELVGVSSHELYHTWNVKSLRPADWMPYDFTRPGFSRMGYIAEGVTTYMGDWMLWQSDFFSDEAFLDELSTHIQHHIDNEGRFNLSLADSSVDTWVDGYGGAAPRRRVSIYVEGALLALVCDIQIMDVTAGKRGLADVMRSLYQKYGHKKGFTEDQYWDELKAFADFDWDALRRDVVDGTGKLIGYVEDSLSEMDLRIFGKKTDKPWESAWGVRFSQIRGNWEVSHVRDGSPAEKSGIWFGDKLIEIGGETPEVFFAKSKSDVQAGIPVKLRSGFRQKTCIPLSDGKIWIKKYRILADHDSDQKLFYKWKKKIRKRKESIRPH